ncbi:uncharacterized protein SCHCODRAFT_02308173 [Schizophyllum commune H4-8]|uniref:uncharacterized protein n=1 Tax=Schizophyllum commune (strain H4-8 / FGSC 9210) TaxID=578458 RepID=UPI0021608848|nr:uncharacterized protein SCHCODRAFT_02308173 [Schizophyllum commune H4-8]KAI5891001.1 hypothetical protein SCHCODRAFT_02308173 [Schizophyllum commune H4-8]
MTLTSPLQPEGNLFRDRFVSLQNRALVEPRVRVMCVSPSAYLLFCSPCFVQLAHSPFLPSGPRSASTRTSRTRNTLGSGSTGKIEMSVFYSDVDECSLFSSDVKILEVREHGVRSLSM